MAESLFLNKKRIDLYKTRPITRKIQIGEVSEIVERKSSFSYTIKIPKTSNNLKVFEMIGVDGNTSRKPFEEVIADYVVDNVYLVQNGSAIIRNVNEKDISINLIDGFRGLSNILSDKRINEIDFSDLNHTLTKELAVASMENIEGYIYAYADFGKGYVFDYIENLAPSIFLHTIISRIFSEAGFELTGDFLTTDEKYLNEVLTPCNGYEVSIAGTDVIISDIMSNEKQVDIIKDFANRHGLLMKPNSDLTGFEFKKLQDVLNSRSGAEDWSDKVSEYKNETFDSGYSQINTAKFKYPNETDEKIDGNLLVDNFNAPTDKSIFDSIFEMPSVSGLLGFARNLPAKEIYLIPIWGDYVQKIGNVETEITSDITDTAKRIKLDGTLENYTNGIVRRYTVDVYNEAMSEFNTFAVNGWLFGAGYCLAAYYDSSDVFISYELEGTATPVSYEKLFLNVPNSTKYIRVQGFLTDASELFEYRNLYYDSAEITTTPSKIMYIDRLACYMQFDLFSYGWLPVYYVPFLSKKFMSLQYSLDNNYKSFKDLLNNYKKIELIANLSLIDIYNNDFFKLKYLKQTGRFYYINNIRYSYGGLSKCEALELQSFAINYSPTISDFTKKVRSFIGGSVNATIISRANFLMNYFDKEYDEPLKVKIISGFNSNIKLYQDAVEITSEIEIDYVDLNLLAAAQIGGYTNYSESWVFNIMDSGSEEYSENTAVLTVQALGNYSVVKPTANGSLKSGESLTIPSGVESRRILSGRYSSSPYDDGDNIKYFEFGFLTKPADSTAIIEQNIEDYEGTIVFTGAAADFGAYTIRLIVTSVSGLTDLYDFNLTFI